MKSTAFIATLLTLLTLLLVVGAAALFLLQGWQKLQTDTRLLQSEVEGHNQTIVVLQTTAAAREMALATSGASLTTRDSELGQSQSLLATREVELEQGQAMLNDLAATLEAERELVSEEPPLLEIISPLNGAVITTDDALQILIAGGYSQGIDSLSIFVGDRSPTTIQNNGDAFRLFRHNVPGLVPGQLAITATLTTADNQTVSDRVRITVRSPEPQQDDTQGLISSPLADLPHK